MSRNNAAAPVQAAAAGDEAPRTDWIDDPYADLWSIVREDDEDLRMRAGRDYVAALKQALAAPRVPTEVMLDAAREWSRVFVGTPIGNKAATGCWQAMWDASGSVPSAGTVTVEEMAERLVLGLRNAYPRFDADLPMQPWLPQRLLTFILTGLPPSPDRDAKLSAILARLSGADASPQGHPVRIGYTNWRGEATTPTIVPVRLFWGSNEWHPEPCWLLEAMDIEKQALRTFDLRRIRAADAAATKGLWEAATAYRDAVDARDVGLLAARDTRALVNAEDEDAIEAAERAFDEAGNRLCAAVDEARFTLDVALALAEADDGWRPIGEAKKDRSTPYLLKLKNPIPRDREDLRAWDGLCFVGRHGGITPSGYDMGWQFAAPVGHGGFPDEWFDGFRPIAPPAPASAVGEAGRG